MALYTDFHNLLYRTPECTGDCTGLCGYCPKHEKARKAEYGEWVIGPEPNRCHHREQPTVYMSTSGSQYPRIYGREKGIQYGRGTMKTTVPYGHPFTHNNAGMILPAIAGKGKVFGLPWDTAYLLTVGGRCWRN